MALAVGFGGEGKLADEALERPLSIVRSEMSIEGAAVSTGVRTLFALVRRRASMQ